MNIQTYLARAVLKYSNAFFKNKTSVFPCMAPSRLNDLAHENSRANSSAIFSTM